MKGIKQGKRENTAQEEAKATPSRWTHWTKAAVAFTMATGTYVLSKVVGVVWGGSEGALLNATSEADTDSQNAAHTPLRNTQPIHLHPAIPSIGTTPIPLGDFSKVERFEFTAAYPTPTLLSNNLLFMASLTLLQPRLSFPAHLTTLVLSHLEGAQAALPTVANPIPPQTVEAGQPFSFDFDLNQIFDDADGDQMTFGGVTQADGSALPSWVRSEPILLGSVDTPGLARGVTVQNDVALVADDDFGLQVINVSTPSAPILLGSYNTPGNAYGVTVQNDVALVADGSSGLQVINVSTPSAPTLLGSVDTPGNAYGVTVQNDVALVADGSSGLQVINVSTPSAPTLLGRVDTQGTALGITVQNDVALVAYGSSGLQVINVSIPSAPTLLGSYDTPGYALGVTVQNGVAFVADYGSGLQILDLGQTRFLGILRATAMGPYNFTLSATNENGEWISTDFELRVSFVPMPSPPLSRGIFPNDPSWPAGTTQVQNTNQNQEISTMLSGASSTESPSPSATPSLSNSVPFPISSDSGTRPNSNNPSLSSSASTLLTTSPIDNGQTFPGFNIVSIEALYLEVGVETTLTIDNLSVQGYTGDPRQLMFMETQTSGVTILVSGTESNQFSLFDLQSGYVDLLVDTEDCSELSDSIELEASDGVTTAGFTLIFVLDTASCSYASASRLKSTESVVMLLVTSGLGMFAASRGAKEKVNRAQTAVIETDESLSEEMGEAQHFGYVNA